MVENNGPLYMAMFRWDTIFVGAPQDLVLGSLLFLNYIAEVSQMENSILNHLQEREIGVCYC